jgi:hypothetical protein
MSTTPSKFSDAKYLAFVENALKICRDNLLLYKIPEADYTKAENLASKAKLAFEANSLKASRNENTTREKNTAFKELKTYMSWFSKTLETNLNVPNDALLAMGLPSRNPEHHPEPPPVEQGYVKIKKVGAKHRGSLNQKTDNQTKESTVGKHASGGTEWECQIGNGPIVPMRSSKSSIMVDTPDELKGKPLRMRARWVNAKYEPGPWSEWAEIFIN